MPSRGLHYPGSYDELRAWFPDDEACMDYLDWLRWPSGPVCPKCGRAATTIARGRV
ncbi:MAG: transposase, partial [Nocardioidaceae bacterium]